MTHRTRFSSSAMVLSLALATSPLLHAAMPAPHAPNTASTPAKGKLVKFSIRNDSKLPLQLKAGDQQMTIAPGQTAAVKLQVGLQVTTLTETAKLPSGSVLTTVSDSLQGNTLAVS